MAETHRRGREIADALGIPRPSYERVRQEIKISRLVREHNEAKRDLVLDVYFRRRPVEALSELIGDPAFAPP